MHVVCIHCGHHFDHEAPAYAQGEGSAVCPACGRDTPTGEEWGLDGGLPEGFAAGPGAESRVYCFNCGKEMTPRDGELIPVCDECRQETSGPSADLEAGASELPPVTDEPVADWMIRKGNGNVYGPFPAETIVEWIKARKINADEEIAHIGGAWRLFGQHEEFGHYFEKSPDAAIPASAQEIDFRRRSPVRDAVRGLGRIGVLVLVLGLIGGGVWYAIQTDALVVSESLVNKAADQIEAARRSEDKTPMAEDAVKLLADLAAAHPEIAEPDPAAGGSSEHFLRGRTLMLRDGVQDLKDARTQLERAVLLDPRNPLALGALAELYNLLVERGEGSLDLQRQAIYLIELADGAGNNPAEVLRARAAFLIYSGNEAEGVGVAQQAMQKNPEDPALHFLLGVAGSRAVDGVPDGARRHFDKALELDPGYHQVWFELGRGAEETGQLREAIAHLDRKIELDARSAAANSLLGVIYERVGDHSRATSHYDRAVALHPTNKTAVSRRAILAYQVDGEAAKAASMLDALLKNPAVELKIRERKEYGVHLAAARRLAGDVEGALAAAQSVLKEDKNYSPALFQNGLALVASGAPHKAVPEFTRAESPELSPNVRARIAFFQGHAAAAGGQTQDAMESFTRSYQLDQDFVPGYLWAGYVNLELGNPKRAAQIMLEHVGRDPLNYARVRDPDLFFEPLPPLTPVSAALKKAVDAETFAPDMNAALGAVLFHEGRGSDAAPYLKKARQQDERHEAAFFYTGLIEYRNKRHKRAYALFAALLDVHHNKGVYHVYAGDSLLALGRLDDAISAYEKGQGYGSKSTWSHTRMAEALAKRGESEPARKQLAEAVKLDDRAVAPRQQLFQLNL